MDRKRLIAILVCIIGIVAILQIAEAAGTLSGIIVSNTKYEPYPAEPGGYVEIWFLVKNRGDQAAQNVVLQLDPEYPFSLDRKEDAYNTISFMTGGGEALVSYKVRVDVNAIEGVSQIKVKYWAGGETSATTDSFNIQVASKKNIEISEISPQILKPGEVSNLNFTITNKGRSPIQDITFTWQESKDTILPVGSDNKRYVKFIDADQSVPISFKVAASPSASPGIYSLMMSISYTDMNKTQRNLSSRAGIVIGGETDFEVAQQDSTGTTTSLIIANVGVNPAFSVLVHIPAQQGISAGGSSSTMIGNLNPGDYTFANFQISRNFTDFTRGPADSTRGQFSDSPRGPYKLLIGIQYTDTLGQRQALTREVTIQPQSVQTAVRTQTNDSTMIYLGALAVILILLGIWKRDRIMKAIGRQQKQDQK